MPEQIAPPIHPGEILKEQFIEPRGLTINQVAAGLNMHRTNLSYILNKRASISTELAIKLSVAFGNSAQFWLDLQREYDLWQAEQNVDKKKITRFPKLN